MDKSSIKIENLSYGLIVFLLLWNVYSIISSGDIFHAAPIKPRLNDILIYFLFVFVIYLSPVLWSRRFPNKLLRIGVFIWYVGTFLDITAGVYHYYINKIIHDTSPYLLLVSEILNMLLSLTALALYVAVRIKGKKVSSVAETSQKH